MYKYVAEDLYEGGKIRFSLAGKEMPDFVDIEIVGKDGKGMLVGVGLYELTKFVASMNDEYARLEAE